MSRIKITFISVILVALGSLTGWFSVYMWSSNPNIARAEALPFVILTSGDVKEVELLTGVSKLLGKRSPKELNRYVCALIKIKIDVMKSLLSRVNPSSEGKILQGKLLADLEGSEHVYQSTPCVLYHYDFLSSNVRNK